MMKTAEALDEAGRCLAQALALLTAVQQLAARWEAAGDHAHATELLSVAGAAMSGATATTAGEVT